MRNKILTGTKTGKEEPNMYQMIRKSGIGERAEPIGYYYRNNLTIL